MAFSEPKAGALGCSPGLHSHEQLETLPSLFPCGWGLSQQWPGQGSQGRSGKPRPGVGARPQVRDSSLASAVWLLTLGPWEGCAGFWTLFCSW